MSGVNAHALVAQPGTAQAYTSATALQWQRTRLHVVPAAHSFLESLSYSSASRTAVFAVRLASSGAALLWGCSTLPAAVALELGLAAGSMLQVGGVTSHAAAD